MAPLIVSMNYMNLKTLTPFFSELPDKQKHCRIFVDEIHKKPAILYQEDDHVKGYSLEERSRPVRKVLMVLAIFIAPMMEAPALICRVIPV